MGRGGVRADLRENEAKFVEKIKEDLAKGTTWERITELIGLENSRAWRGVSH